MRIKVSRFESAEAAQADAQRRVDDAAEQARTKHLTPGSGQVMEYEEAHRQALAFEHDPTDDYPMLQADVDAGLAENVAQAAQTIIAMRQQWEQVGQQIRTIRLKAKREIRESDDPAEIAQIRERAVEALAGI